MAPIIKALRRRWDGADLNTRLIFCTMAVTILVWLVHFVLVLFRADPYSLERELWLSPDLYTLSRHPWSILSYMWIHADVWHLLFNMLWLHWFGRLFLRYQFPKRLFSLYLLGGMAGGLLYVIVTMLSGWVGIEFFGRPLVGASAGVMAIVFGTAFYARWERVQLLFVGQIRLTTLAIGLFLLDILLLTGGNYGGHLAHIGGALFGVWFALSLARGRDITAWFQRLGDRLVDGVHSFGRSKRSHGKSTFRVHNRKDATPSSPSSAPTPTDASSDAAASVDDILDKIRISGYTSLTAEEKRRLFEQSKRL